MKIKLVLLALLSLVTFSNAATTITAANFTFTGGLGGTVITDATGARLGTFSLAVGRLSEGAFVINGSGTTVNVTANSNTFNSQITTALVTAGNGFLGQNVVVAIGNAATFAASTQFILFSTPTLWAAEDPVLGGSASANIDLRTATLVPGTGALTTASTAGVNAPFNTLTSGVTFVPEPSVALLGLLGAVGFLRRRR